MISRICGKSVAKRIRLSFQRGGILPGTMEGIMKAIHCIIAALACAEPAHAAVTDPEVVIYRFPGVFDSGGADNAGVATVFFCTNFSGVLENIRFVTRQSNAMIATNVVFALSHLTTLIAVTHPTFAYSDAGPNSLATGFIQGTAAIAATSINIICTAETIDASTAAPVGVARRGIRFNPVPGSQE